jgi:hypothetical protein
VIASSYIQNHDDFDEHGFIYVADSDYAYLSLIVQLFFSELPTNKQPMESFKIVYVAATSTAIK